MKSVSVIMVSYYTGPALWLAIDSVLLQNECSELVLVDNGNSPGDVERLMVLAEQEKRIILLTGHVNIGFARACNLGVHHATSEFILLLNPDSLLMKGDLAKAIDELLPYPVNVVAGCFLANPDGTEQAGGRRSLMTPLIAAVENLRLYQFFPGMRRLNYNHEPMPPLTHEVPAISGAFMLMRRSYYHLVGGMDEGYFFHMEDMDFCLKVNRAGGKTICIPSVRVTHFRSTSAVSSITVEKHKARGFVRYFYHNFYKSFTHPVFILLQAMIWLRFLFKLIITKVNSYFEPPSMDKKSIARLVLLHRMVTFGKNDESRASNHVLITGASSQIGIALVGKMLSAGVTVTAIYNSTSVMFKHPRLTWVKADLQKNIQISNQTVIPELVIHVSPVCQLPALLEDFFKHKVKRIIAFSSTSVAGKAASRNAYEKGLVNQIQDAETAILKQCKEQECPVTILRHTMAYGVGLDYNISRIADTIRRFGMMFIYKKASGLRHPVHVMDLVDAVVAVKDNSLTYGKVYNLGGKQTMTYRSMILFLFRYLGKYPKIYKLFFMPVILDVLGFIYQVKNINGEIAIRMNQDLVFDIHEASEDFGYKPRGFLEGDVII